VPALVGEKHTTRALWVVLNQHQRRGTIIRKKYILIIRRPILNPTKNGIFVIRRKSTILRHTSIRYSTFYLTSCVKDLTIGHQCSRTMITSGCVAIGILRAGRLKYGTHFGIRCREATTINACRFLFTTAAAGYAYAKHEHQQERCHHKSGR